MCIEFCNQNIAYTGLEAILAGLLSAITAQILKFAIFTLRTRKINFKIFTTTGGMPSTHSAGVVALATSVGVIQGFNSIDFAIAIGFSLVTMYDAAGVRRAAGKTAASLNKMMEEFYNHDLRAVGGKLKELLGHTPLEVFVGAIYGILFAFDFHILLTGCCF